MISLFLHAFAFRRARANRDFTSNKIYILLTLILFFSTKVTKNRISSQLTPIHPSSIIFSDETSNINHHVKINSSTNTSNNNNKKKTQNKFQLHSSIHGEIIPWLLIFKISNNHTWSPSMIFFNTRKRTIERR